MKLMNKNSIALIGFVLGILAAPAIAQTLFLPSGSSGIGSVLSGGDVGIGTNAPAATFHVKRSGGGPVARFESTINNDGQSYVYNRTANTVSIWGAFDYGYRYAYVGTESSDPFVIITDNAARMWIDSGGNVGVGTSSPGAKLDLAYSSAVVDGLRFQDTASGGVTWRIGSGVGGTGLFGFYNETAAAMRVAITSSGNVGIGTTSPGSYKLAVNGAIHAKQVVVESGWSDYVFEPDYRLAPLSEIEAHIKAEKHLPGIPSAREVAEHGVDVGDMQSKLLAKVEELTLHLIRMEKENAEMRRELDTLKVSGGHNSQP